MNLEIVQYTPAHEEKWDRFIQKSSVNGTFLQTRRFLKYHPEDRFQDCSLLVMQGSNIVAAIPACDVDDEGKRCFFSHKGSTFGGIILDQKKYNISTLEAVFPLLEEYFVEQGFEKVIFKQTSDIFSIQTGDILDYFYFKNGFEQFNELSFYVDCSSLPEKVEEGFASSARRHYRASLKNDLKLCQLSSKEQIQSFYKVLCMNLKKYGVVPVHTLEELYDLRFNRLQEEVDFYGVYSGQTLIGGTMLFYFDKHVMHSQYLAQHSDYTNMFTMSFMNTKLIEMARDKGYKYLSFGISTEERGKVLNNGLALFKESFGARYCVNRSFYKEY